MVRQAHRRVGVYYHIFPTYGEAKDSIWRDPAMISALVPEQLIAKKNETELVIYFKNGSVYQLKGSDQPDALRGPNPMGVIFDEYDTQNAAAWGIIEPVIRANGGWAWFIGTPRGRQKLYDLYNRGQEGHKEWGSWLLKASESGIIDPEQLQEARRSMGERLYSQEFECEFLESAGSVFRGVRDIMTAQPSKPVPGRLYVMGVDLAKVQDFTVVRVYDRETNAMIFTDRWQTLDWVYQKRKITAYAHHFHDCLTIVDATGLGDPICDDLIRSGVSVIPFKITAQTKKDLVEKLSVWIEQRLFTMFKSEEAALEYDNFSYDVSPTGGIKYGARSGYHDDIVMADALAIWHLNKVFIPENYIEPTPTQILLQRAKIDYENNQTGGEDREFDEWASSGMDESGY